MFSRNNEIMFSRNSETSFNPIFKFSERFYINVVIVVTKIIKLGWFYKCLISINFKLLL